jgi:hypothetical protein
MVLLHHELLSELLWEMRDTGLEMTRHTGKRHCWQCRLGVWRRPGSLSHALEEHSRILKRKKEEMRSRDCGLGMASLFPFSDLQCSQGAIV